MVFLTLWLIVVRPSVIGCEMLFGLIRWEVLVCTSEAVGERRCLYGIESWLAVRGDYCATGYRITPYSLWLLW